jgi:shikimate kinase
MGNIILLGMPSSGKSTKGRSIAEMLEMDFIDTDELIKEKAGADPAELVERYGREFFLKVQDRTVSGLKVENTVIATGGGIIYSKGAMERLNKLGTVVFLNVPLDIISKRVDRNRKLSGRTGESLRELFFERQPLYRKYADIEIDCEGLESDEIVREVIKEIKR